MRTRHTRWLTGLLAIFSCLTACLTTCLTACLTTCLTACQDGEHFAGMRSPAEKQQLLALNDSMQQLTPNAPRLIREAMNKAKDSLTWYEYHLMYGMRHLLTDTPDSLLPYVSRTLRFTERQPATPRTMGLKAMALSSKASYYHLLYQRPNTVIRLYRKAYNLMMQSDIKEKLPDLSANLGDAYVTANNLPEGSKWYRRALVLVDSLGLPDSHNITLYMGLGRIYTNMANFPQARDFYERADKHFDQMKPNMQSYFLNNYGNYFYYHKEYDKALHLFRRMKQHIEKYQATENFDMYLCKVNMADVFLNLGQTDSARRYIEEAEPYFRRNGVGVGVFYAHTISIGIALREKRYAEVQRILDEEHGATCSDANINSIRNDYLSQYYSAVGDYRKAFAILKDNTLWRDSTEHNLSYMQSAEIMNRLTEDTIRLHHQIAMNQQEIRYARNTSMLWMVLLLLMLAVLFFVLWLSRERKRRLQTQLDMVTLRLANARQRISPHFVFNVLNSRIVKTESKDAEELMLMARLIRSNLDLSSRSNISLAEELDFVRQYVEIERRLIGEDFEFVLDVPEQRVLESIQVPSMLVQILTENAILHGLKNQPGHKRLVVAAACDASGTTISVIDNGPGFDIRRYNSERSRTGLNIIRTTIASINQKNKHAKMRFDISNDHGCHATITIPRDIRLI